MSDRYIPKVGDEGFEWQSSHCETWTKCGKVVAETDEQIAFLWVNGGIGVLRKTQEFRPTPTKADVEREQLCELLEDSCAYVSNEGLAEEIQRLGFTIPKKVSFRDLSESMVGYSMNHNLELWWLEEGKTLLADLVEDEA